MSEEREYEGWAKFIVPALLDVYSRRHIAPFEMKEYRRLLRLITRLVEIGAEVEAEAEAEQHKQEVQ